MRDRHKSIFITTDLLKFPTEIVKRKYSYKALYLCKSITLRDVVLDSIHFQVHANVEVFPLVILSTFVLRQTLPFDPFPLWYPRVLHHGLSDAYTVILKVVVNDHRTNAAHLFGGMQDVFLKVCIEPQHLEDNRL